MLYFPLKEVFANEFWAVNLNKFQYQYIRNSL